MVEYFGAAAASVALLTQLTQCGIEIHKAVKRIKSSRSDIAELADETIMFAGLCNDFSRERMDERGILPTRSPSVDLLDIWIEKTLGGLKKVLRTVEALQIDRQYSSLEQTLIAYLEWFFSKALVKRLRANMAVARQSVGVFSNLICIRKLNQELQMLRDALTRPSERRNIEQKLGMTLENKIDMLQQTVKIKHTVHHTSARQVRAAADDIARRGSSRRSIDLVPVPTELLYFTASLDTFAEEIIPARRSSRRMDSSRASSNLSSAPGPWFPASQSSSVPTRPSATSRTASTMSTTSTTSVQTPIFESRSVASPSIAQDGSPHTSRHVVNESSNSGEAPVERRDTRPREYINDPNGSILSPPKVKSHDTNYPKRQIKRIGRHVVGLTGTEFTLNGYSLPVEDYGNGQKFYQTVVQTPEYLDTLDEALGRGSEDWCGIPEWVVNPSEVTARAAAIGVRDVRE